MNSCGTVEIRALEPAGDIAAHGRCLLNIMATSDLHMHLLAYDYMADRAAPDVGLVGLAPLISRIRAASRNTLLLDNGDFLQGSAMGDFVARSHAKGNRGRHPIIAAMNELDYDAIGLGNHEFDYGVDFLLSAARDAAFPMLCSNLVFSPADPAAGLLQRSVILTRDLIDETGATHPICIGLLGLLPPQTQSWNAPHLSNRSRARDMVETAAEMVPRLRAGDDTTPGCDLVILLAHCGIGPQRPEPWMENAATALAAIDGVDAIIAGHTHEVFPAMDAPARSGVDGAAGTLAGKPAVMPGYHGSHLGVIALDLRCGSDGWHIASHEAQVLPCTQADPQTRRLASACAVIDTINQAADADHCATIGQIRRPLGRTMQALNSFFAMIQPSPGLALIAESKRRHIRDRLSQGPDAGLPVLAAIAPYRAGGYGGPHHYADIAPGPVTLGAIVDLYSYPNAVHAVRVNGAELADWLERAASVFNRITPGGTDQLLLNPGFASYQFDVIDGLDYQIDLSQPARYDADGHLAEPAAHRIRDLSHKGQPVREKQMFIIATSSFRAATMPLRDGQVVYSGADCAREVLARHVASCRVVSPRPNGHWGFAPMGGTPVLFDTSPEAHAHLDDVGLRIEPAGDGPNGFARFRIYL